MDPNEQGFKAVFKDIFRGASFWALGHLDTLRKLGQTLAEQAPWLAAATCRVAGVDGRRMTEETTVPPALIQVGAEGCHPSLLISPLRKRLMEVGHSDLKRELDDL